MPLLSIDDVLAELDRIIDVCRKRGTADGYFAALYRRVTAAVKDGVARGAFEDNERMARFDVLFASRYIDAWNQHERGEKPTAAWATALGCATSPTPVVLQHLLVGMNAHINLDLGIVAAEIAPGAAIGGLKNDFNAINQLLADLVNDVQDRLAAVWPIMTLIDELGGDLDESVVNFSIGRAREHAWLMAQALAAMPEEARAAYIQTVDTAMALLGQGVLNPGLKARAVLALVRAQEHGTVSEKLDILLK
jgi:hypothetical protein